MEKYFFSQEKSQLSPISKVYTYPYGVLHNYYEKLPWPFIVVISYKYHVGHSSTKVAYACVVLTLSLFILIILYFIFVLSFIILDFVCLFTIAFLFLFIFFSFLYDFFWFKGYKRKKQRYTVVISRIQNIKGFLRKCIST